MKIQLPPSCPDHACRQGSAVIIILAMLATMTLLVASNTRTVNWLRTEVRLVDQHELARLNASATNQVTGPIVAPAATPAP